MKFLTGGEFEDVIKYKMIFLCGSFGDMVRERSSEVDRDFFRGLFDSRILFQSEDNQRIFVFQSHQNYFLVNISESLMTFVIRCSI